MAPHDGEQGECNDERAADDQRCRRWLGTGCRVGEVAQQFGQRQGRYRQQHPEDEGEANGGFLLPEPRRELTVQREGPSGGCEVGTGPHQEHDAHVAVLEGRLVECVVTVGRVVDVVTVVSESLQHQEVAELPEQDCRRAECFQVLGGALPPGHFDAMDASRALNVGSGTAVSTHAAGLAEFVHPDPLAKISENDAETRRAAFARLDLLEYRGPSDRAQSAPETGEC